MLHARVPAQSPIERRRSEVERISSATGDVFRVSYFIGVTGSGELQVPVNFPVWFTERPAVFSSGELEDGQTLTTGSYPWWNAGVASWTITTIGGGSYWTGANVVIVCGGPSDMISTVHFHAEGKALQQPINPAA